MTMTDTRVVNVIIKYQFPIQLIMVLARKLVLFAKFEISILAFCNSNICG